MIVFKYFLFNVFTFLNNWVLQIHFILAPTGLKDGKCDTKELQISILIQDKMIVFIYKNSTSLSPAKRDQQQTHTHTQGSFLSNFIWNLNKLHFLFPVKNFCEDLGSISPLPVDF